MKILSIESASVTASCAVAEDENILGEYTLRHKKLTRKNLCPWLKN